MPNFSEQDDSRDSDSCRVEDTDEDLIYLKEVELVVEQKNQTKLDQLLNELESFLQQKHHQTFQSGRVPDFKSPAYRSECIRELIHTLTAKQHQYSSHDLDVPERSLCLQTAILNCYQASMSMTHSNEDSIRLSDLPHFKKSA